MTMRCSVVLLAIGVSITACAADTLVLPRVPMAREFAQKFELRPDRLTNTWGRGNELQRVYFQEMLPALLARTLQLDTAIPTGATIAWIFTGSAWGFTVEAGASKVKVFQRYYDSFGLHDGPPSSRHPEKIRETITVPYRGQLRQISAFLNHRLQLEITLNGKLAVRQACLLDVNRHQLLYSPGAARTNGLTGALIAPKTTGVRIVLHPEERHQRILGFGGITSVPAYDMLSAAGKEQWWDLRRAYNLLIDRQYPMGPRLKPDFSNSDRVEDAVPHYYGDNFPNSEVTDFSYLARILRGGGLFTFEFWQVPPSVKSAGNGSLDPVSYARAMVAFCNRARQLAGQPPAIAGVQNEILQPGPVWYAMVRELRRALDAAGFPEVRIHMPDAASLAEGIRRVRTLRPDPATWKAIDYTATHFYDYQDFFQSPDEFDARLSEWKQAAGGKPFLSTELCINDKRYQSGSYRLALAMGELYHKNLTALDAVALMYCWLLLDVEQPTYGATRSLFVPDRAHGFQPRASSFQLRVFGAFSRRLPAGMERVGTSSTGTDLLVSAFSNGKGGETLIVMNRSVRPMRLAIDWQGVRFRVMERTNPYSENTVEPMPETVVLAPGEIATLSNVALQNESSR